MLDLKKIKQLDDFNLENAFDYLTGVLNKECIIHYVDKLIEENKKFTLYFFDVDDFKNINDTKGHPFGDYVLKRLASKISEHINDKGLIARYGGDEFIAIIEDIIDYEEVWNICKSFTTVARDLGKEMYEDSKMPLTITLGVASYPTDGKCFDDILDNADKALYRGKKKGRNCFIIYNPKLHSTIREEIDSSLDTIKLIDYIYSEYTDSELPIKVKLAKIAKFFCQLFIVDSISLDTFDKFEVLFIAEDKYLNLKTCDYTKYIKNDLKYRIVSSVSLFQNEEAVYSLLTSQNIKAFMHVKIEINGKTIGVLRADSKRDRVWSAKEKEVFVSLAYILAIVLRYSNEKL